MCLFRHDERVSQRVSVSRAFMGTIILNLVAPVIMRAASF